jgi:signal transduction histidine kinase
MFLREWLRPPRAVLALFLVVTLVPAAGLVWLGWYLLQQDRALVDQRVQERRERAADLLVGTLDTKLRAVEQDLTKSSARELLAQGDDAVLVVLGPAAADAYPRSHLLYYPIASPCQEAVELVFRAGEDREFRLHDYAGAIASFRELSRSEDATVRAGAQVRIARNLRKAGQMDLALAAYQDLAQSGAVPIGCVPASLLARRARCALLSELKRTEELRREAEALYADLRGGRWQLDRALYDLHAQDVRGWLGVDQGVEQEARSLATGAEWLWERWQAASQGSSPASGRHSMQAEGRFVTLVWTASAEGLVGLIAGPRFVDERWLTGVRPILDAQSVQLSLKDRDSRAVLGAPPASLSQRTERAASDTGLPWTLLVASANPRADLDQLAQRQRLLLAGLALVAILVSTGSYFTARAFLRELAVARLQSDFVAAVSHEFRTPLASLRQLTENLLDGRVTTDDRRAAYYRAQARATGRLHRLVEGLLDFGRMEAGVLRYRLEPLEVGDLVHSTVEEFRQDHADRGHQVELTLGDGLPAINGDREALTRALWNLLDNAVKYSPGAPTIWVEAARDKDAVAVRVRDAGLGIGADEEKEIFRKFHRGSAAHTAGVKGTGIGLAMVQHIVRAHGGHVRLESAPGAGTTFTIVLPTGRDQGSGIRDQGSGIRPDP